MTGLQLQDDDREGKPLNMLTEQEELQAYVKATTAYNTVDELDGARVVQRKQFTFANTIGEHPIDIDELRHSANRLESLQYNVPLYVQGAPGPSTAAEMQDVSMH